MPFPAPCPYPHALAAASGQKLGVSAPILPHVLAPYRAPCPVTGQPQPVYTTESLVYYNRRLCIDSAKLSRNLMKCNETFLL